MSGRRAASFAGVITQILLLDIVFSLDSVITAVGMAEHVAVMIIAVVDRRGRDDGVGAGSSASSWSGIRP